MTPTSHRTIEYTSLQVRKILKDQIVAHCEANGLKISRFVEIVFSKYISGSGEVR